MAITRVQTVKVGTDGAVQSTLTTANFGSSVTSGNLIVVAIRTSSKSVTGVTDTLGTTYTNIAGATDTTQDPHMAIWYGVLTSSGTNAVTGTISANDTYFWVDATEYTGNTATPLDTSDAKTGTGVTDCVSNAITTTGAGLVLVAISQPTLTDYTAGTNYALVDGSINATQDNAGQHFGGVEERFPTGSLSSEVQHITSGATNAYTMVTAAFLATGGGGGSTNWGPWVVGGMSWNRLVQ